MDPSRWPLDTVYAQALALTSPTGGGRLVGIVRSRTKATEFVLFVAKEGNNVDSVWDDVVKGEMEY
jgi:hypothetical protein